ncbi:NAD(P)-binding protein [Hypoxylon rubiginosum]|uniref:NAD(P)-binding protein n=1 Tax=Hypoxylon rubiginosum TaxID=110542 RepID=A0ACC0D7U2_9PEZI|nr:NAD(P)-binding protein [Hypoxylon rubiginosum]
MSKPWILVSPASRGIGHALTRHLLRTTTAPILVTTRTDLPGVRASILDSLESSPSSSLSSSSQAPIPSASERLHVTELDVEHEPTVQAAAAEAARLFPAKTHHLHLAFALPGILHPEKSPRDVDYDAALQTLRVNVLGPLMLMKWFEDFLPRRGTDMHKAPIFRKGVVEDEVKREDEEEREKEEKEEKEAPHATWLTASARVGSTSDNRLGGWYTYRASKAAVNSLTKTFDLHLKTRGGDRALAVAYHPGTVRTGLSREFWGRVRADKLFSPEYAAERMVEVVRTRKLADRGRCWDWKGEEVLP